MAGIFANVDSDIQKLQKLKMEIENVKKALKQINVKVDIDIAKGMEAQLQSLMGQYDALVRKVSEAEGKITLSTKRINDASEKIIKAQEQLSKAVGVNPRPGSGNANTTANNTETTSVQAQAKAYDELEAEINKVLGTREQNIRKLIEESNAIKLNQRLIKQTEKEYTNSNGVISEKGLKLLEIYNNNLLRHKATLSEVQQVLRNEEKLYNASENSMSRLSQELSRMRIAYRAMTDDAKNSPFGKELLASIDQADAKIKSLDASIGNHQRNVGNYASGWNGLNMSVQQIVRELPAATMGLNMFFLAISNNLPILTDEIKRAKERNAELIAQNQKATPVWKQLVSSIFSWQTAMMVGITILSTYGKDIVNWVKGLFSAEKQLDATVEAQKKLNEAQAKGIQNAQSELLKLNLLRKESENEQTSRTKRLKAVSELQRLYPDYLGNIDKEKILAGDVSNIYKTLAGNILNAAKAKAQFEEATKAAQEAVELEKTFRNLSKESPLFNLFPDDDKAYIKDVKKRIEQLEKIRQETQENTSKALGTFTFMPKNEEQKKLESIVETYTKWQDKIKETNEIASNIDAFGIIFNSNSNDSEKALQIRQKIADELIQLQKTNQQREIDLMKEGSEKKIAQINLDYKEQIEAIKKQADSWEKEQGGTLTSEQTMQVSIAYSFIRKNRNRDIAEVYQKQKEDEAKAMNDYLKEYGTYQEKKLALTKEYDKKIAEATTEGERLSLQKELDEAISALDFNKFKKEINWEVVFGDLSKATKKQLNDIKQQLNKFKKSSEFKNAAPDQIKIIEEALDRINDTLVDKGGFFGGLEEALSKYRNAVEEVTKAQEELTKALEEGDDVTIEKAQENLNNAKGREVAAQINVDKAKDKAVKNMTAVANAMNQLGSAKLNLSDFGSVVGNLVDTLSASGSKIGGLIAAILSIIDSIGEQGITNFVTNLVGNIVNNIKEAGIRDIKLTSGGLIDLKFLKGADYSSYNKMKEEYEQLNDIWDELIDKKKEYIDISYGDEAYKVGKEAEELVRKSIESYKELGRERLDAGSSAGSHSIGVRQRKNMSDQGWEEAKKALGQDFYNYDIGEGRMKGLFDLSTQQLEKLKSEAPTFWAKLDDDVRNYLNNIIAGEEQIEDIQEKVKEQLTQVSFDSMYDNFVDTLMDMDSSSKDFADDVSSYFMRAMLSNFIGEEYRDKLKDWYDKFATSMENDTLDRDMDSLRAEYQKYVEEAIKERDNLAKITGYDSTGTYTQESSKKGFATASQDSIDSLEGRFTAGQIAWEETKNQAVMQNEKLSILNLKVESLLNISSEQRNIADETRTILAKITGYDSTGTYTQESSKMQNEKLSILDLKVESLLNISSEQRNIADETRTILANSYLELQQINENTGEIVKPIKAMANDIAEVKRNTAGLAR